MVVKSSNMQCNKELSVKLMFGRNTAEPTVFPLLFKSVVCGCLFQTRFRPSHSWQRSRQALQVGNLPEVKVCNHQIDSKHQTTAAYRQGCICGLVFSSWATSTCHTLTLCDLGMERLYMKIWSKVYPQSFKPPLIRILSCTGPCSELGVCLAGFGVSWWHPLKH